MTDTSAAGLGYFEIALAAGAVPVPVQAGIFDKVKKGLDEAAETVENTEAPEKDGIYALDFVNDEFSDTVVGDNGVKAEWSFARLVVNDDAHEKLNAVLRKYCDTNVLQVQDEALEIAENYDGPADGDQYLYYSLCANAARTDSLVVSFWEEERSFDGNTYGDAFTGFNYEAATEKIIKLTDIVQDHIDLVEENRDLLGKDGWELKYTVKDRQQLRGAS